MPLVFKASGFLPMPVSTSLPWQEIALYALGAALVLVLLFRLPYIGNALRALVSVGLLAFAIFLILQQAPFDPGLSQLNAKLGLDRQTVDEREVRIPMARDGHFWVEGRLNGDEVRMLVDSGATVTALSADTAKRAGIEKDAMLVPLLLKTANGKVPAEGGTIAKLEVGGIEARNLKAVISPALGNTDVLGMNFLSVLRSWRVEGKMLILVPVE